MSFANIHVAIFTLHAYLLSAINHSILDIKHIHKTILHPEQ